MKRLNLRVTIITNILLFITIISVCVITFIPSSAVQTSIKDTNSAIYNGNRQKNNVSLMFNVYENTKIVNQIIDVLDKKSVKATFFVGGCWADDNENTLIKIVKSGHEIANHGYFHKDHKKLSYEANYQEIRNTSNIVKALCGIESKLFAPPSGSFSVTTLKASYDLGHKLIMWSKDTIDWRDSDIATIFNRATKNLEGGDLVLMHPKKHTLEILPSIIDYYLSVGFDVVTVSQNIDNDSGEQNDKI